MFSVVRKDLIAFEWLLSSPSFILAIKVVLGIPLASAVDLKVLHCRRGIVIKFASCKL